MRLWKQLFVAFALLLLTSLPALAVCDRSFGGAGGDRVADNIADLCSKSLYPNGSLPVTASATGTTGATAATLPGVANRTTYICGFSVRSNATASVTGNITITGTISGTLNFTHYTLINTSGVGNADITFTPLCIPASAINTAIVVTSPVPGAGGIVSTTVWGYQL